MASLVLTVLSLTIGLFFILVGTMKLSPMISEEMYKELRKGFIKSAKVFPFAAQLGLKISPHLYRQVIGTLEVVCGAILVVIPGPLKEIANLLLFCIMIGATYTHWAQGDGIDKTTPALVFGLLLACRFIIYLQVRGRDAAATPPSSPPRPEKKVQ